MLPNKRVCVIAIQAWVVGSSPTMESGGWFPRFIFLGLLTRSYCRTISTVDGSGKEGTVSTASRNCRNRVQRLQERGKIAPRSVGSRREDPGTLRSPRLQWQNNLGGKHQTPCDPGLCQSDPEAKTAAFSRPGFEPNHPNHHIPPAYAGLKPGRGLPLHLLPSTNPEDRHEPDTHRQENPHTEEKACLLMRRAPASRLNPGRASPGMIARGTLRCRYARRRIAAAPRPALRPMTTSTASARIFRRPRRKNGSAAIRASGSSMPCPRSSIRMILTERMERINNLAAIQRAQLAKMTARWKAGEFDHLYGPYRAKGVLLKPPPKTYVERPAKRGGERRWTRAGRGRIDPAVGPASRGHTSFTGRAHSSGGRAADS